MREFFDTSVLVAAFWGDHPQHAPSMTRIAAASVGQSCCAAHSLAELYAVMTRLPVRPPIPPEQAMLFVQNVLQHLTIVCLDAKDYSSALAEAAYRGISGGRVYDAVLLHCARKSESATIYTWNLADLRRIAPDLSDRILTP